MSRIGTAAFVCVMVLGLTPVSAQMFGLPPDAVNPISSYTVNFTSEYGGAPVHERGTLHLRLLKAEQLIVSGVNTQTGGGARHDVVHASTMQRRAATRRRDGSIVAPGKRSGVDDLLFDYASLVTLIPNRVSHLAVGQHWQGMTACWVSRTANTEVPVTVTVIARRGTTTLLHARGAKQLTLLIDGSHVETSAAVLVDMRFSHGLFSQATMHATQTYARNGTPAGGGTYTWTIRRSV